MNINIMEDFNQPSQQRSNLLEQLQGRIGSVPPYFWAICQVCDLQALEKLLEIACISPPVVRILASQTSSVVLFWTQSTRGTSRSSTPKRSQMKRGPDSSPTGSPLAKRQKTTDSPASSPLAERQKTTDSPASSPLAERQKPASSTLLHRSKAATALARERDGYRCVLTGAPLIEVAHVYPFCQLSGAEENISGVRHVFWDHLRSFWSEEKVAAWEAELFPRGLSEPGNEIVANRITLSKDAHGYWNRGAFALKPISISDDSTTLKVQFFWQKKQPDIQATIGLCTIPPSTEGLDRNEGAFDYGRAADLTDEERKFIKTGDIFNLKTDDPIMKPLPSFKLLELQWFLTRVVGMAGAAFPYEAGSGYGSDDDVPSLDLAGAAFPYEPGSGYGSDDDIPNLDLDEGDTSFLSDIPPQEISVEVNKVLADSPKRRTEESEGNGVGVVVTL